VNTSLNWLKDYLDIKETPEKVSEILTDIGLEVEGEEIVESVKGGLEGIVIGHVKECGKHSGADKLSVTKVDIGGEEDLSIVCGAPNVAVGKKVLVATIGTTLYDKEGKPWKIKKGKIRGEVSEGMLCAEDELGLGEGHDGIMLLPEDVATGTLAKDYFQIENDVVYEIGLTPNRSDATCHLGVAEDLAAALKINYGGDGKVKRPSVDDFKIHSTDMPIEVVVENTEACPRYAGISIRNVTIKESPDWLKNRLNAIGVRPISNIVDITNFILHELGQPLHAFDLDKIAGKKIIVKTLAKDSKFMSLDEQERSLHEEDLMICDGESKGMCIGGVFGGLNSGVTDSTKNIFLESAHFDSMSIRRTSTRHNLRTDAAKVFEKGSDPNVSVYALKRAAMLMVELAGGEIASEIVDIYPNPVAKKEIEVAYDYTNTLIGVEIPKAKVKEILAAMNMDVVAETEETFTVAVPTNKSDVLRPADVVEEILRIYGLNEVPIPTRINSSVVIGAGLSKQAIRNKLGDFLAANGFHEMMAVSLSQSRYYKEILPIAEEELVYVNNTSNIHLDVMRPEMLFSGLEAIVRNHNRQNLDLKLFEFGKSYRKKEGGGFNEPEHLTLFLSGKRWNESWLNKEKSEAGYFTLKSFVGNILKRAGLSKVQESAIKSEVFAYGLKYHRGPQTLVEFGKVNATILKKMDIRHDVYFADVNMDALTKAMRKSKVLFSELNKFPTMRRDLALVIDNSVKFQDIAAIANKVGKKILKKINLFDVYEDAERLGEGKKSYAVSFVFEDVTKTLKDKDVDKVMNNLIKEYEDKLGAIIRR
jgi:phenylalanyl-tRNA synthetase beta chain